MFKLISTIALFLFLFTATGVQNALTAHDVEHAAVHQTVDPNSVNSTAASGIVKTTSAKSRCSTVRAGGLGAHGTCLPPFMVAEGKFNYRLNQKSGLEAEFINVLGEGEMPSPIMRPPKNLLI